MQTQNINLEEQKSSEIAKEQTNVIGQPRETPLAMPSTNLAWPF